MKEDSGIRHSSPNILLPRPVKTHVLTEILRLTANRTANLARRADNTFFRTLLNTVRFAVRTVRTASHNDQKRDNKDDFIHN